MTVEKTTFSVWSVLVSVVFAEPDHLLQEKVKSIASVLQVPKRPKLLNKGNIKYEGGIMISEIQ